MFKPASLSCGHSGCQECLAKLLAVEPNPRCPLCKTSIRNDVPMNINFTLNHLTSKLEVYCTNDGCQWKGLMESTEGHSNRCEKKEVECANNGCQQFLRREDMESHLLECPKEQLPCFDCRRLVTRDCFEEHLATFCSHKRISCPLGCEMTLPRCVFFIHCHLIFKFLLP